MSSALYKQHFIRPDWEAPANIKAFSTTRLCGMSQNGFASFNLGAHVDDNIKDVEANRLQLAQELALPSEPFWLEQVHSERCIAFSEYENAPKADASYAEEQNQVCTVMTADCMPILLTNREGSWVAACHAGWRGLLNGVIENTIAKYPSLPCELVAWIGPSISQPYFEVGEEVLNSFAHKFRNAAFYFEKNSNQKYLFDFVGLARDILKEKGVAVFGGNLCTYKDRELFYSYRRDGRTGRMASLIWLE